MAVDAANRAEAARARTAARRTAARGDLLPPSVRDALLGLADAALDRGRAGLIGAETLLALYDEAAASRALHPHARRLTRLDAVAERACAATRACAVAVRPEAATRASVPLVRLVAGSGPIVWTRAQSLPLPRASEDYDGVYVEIDALPLPVIALPPWWLARPRWLVTLLHELGHDLDAELRLTDDRVRARWTTDLAPHGGLWTAWTAEVVADLVMVALGGPGTAEQVAALLRELHGDPGVTEVGNPHPPDAVRAALLAHAEHRLVGGRQPEPESDPLIASAAAAAALLVTGDHLLARTLRLLAQATDPAWRALVGPSDDAVDQALSAVTSPDPERDDWAALAHRWIPQVAPTLGRDPDSGYKVPPLALLVAHDRVAFVGETHGQLPVLLPEALRLRGGRRFAHLELFFLDAPAVSGLATPDRPFAARWTEREGALRGLVALLPEAADAWTVYEHGDASLFASFWGPADPGMPAAACPWLHIHTSARVWGAEVRTAPSVDYRWRPYGENPVMEALHVGLLHLRGSARRIDGSNVVP